MKYLFLIVFLFNVAENLSAQIIDTTKVFFFKKASKDHHSKNMACGVMPNGYFTLGRALTEYGGKYLSLRKYHFNGKLFADLTLDTEKEGFVQVNYGRCLAQVSETEWVLSYLYRTDGDNGNDVDIKVIKFNLEGEIIWETVYGGLHFDIAQQVVVTEENNIAVVGEKSLCYSCGTTKGYFVLINQENGEIIWELTEENMPLLAISKFRGVIDRGDYFIVGGAREVNNVYMANLKKIDKINGAILEEIILEENIGCSVTINTIPNKPNEFYFETCNDETEYKTRGVMDDSFNIIWDSKMSFDVWKFTGATKPFINEDYSYINLYHDYYPHEQYGLFYKIGILGLDNEGEFSFVTPINIDPDINVRISDICKTPDGGYLLAGYEKYPSPQHGLLIKTDSLGNTCFPAYCDSTIYQVDTIINNTSNLSVLESDSSFTNNFNITTAQSGIKIFPNPISKGEIVNISLNNTNDAIIETQIFSIDGKQLYFQQSNGANQIPINNLLSGVYMVKVRTRKGVLYSRRLVVE